MIGYLNGTIVSIRKNPIILLCGNVGYTVTIPPRMFPTMNLHTEASLYIYTHVKDDAIDLYGFNTEEEIDMFLHLISVSGIGPKTALFVIDKGVKSIEKAISASDVDFFQSVPRLGKKNAQKIIIELKSKIGSIKELDLTGSDGGETKALLEALLAMGFEKQESYRAIEKLEPSNDTMEEKLRTLLKHIGTR